MAASRSRQLPLDLEYSQRYNYEDICQTIVDAVHRYMPRLRSFKWISDIRRFNLCVPAPQLREFCSEWAYTIPRDFLGGSAGALRVLHLGEAKFPVECPALATVTDLLAGCHGYGSLDLGFRRIFDLCPRLEILDLHYDVLPAGPAPRTLRKVSVTSRRNLVPLYKEWELEPVADVLLSTGALNVDFKISAFISGALDLSVFYMYYDSEVRIVAQLPGAHRRTYICREFVGSPLEPIPALVDMLLDGPAVSGMHTLTVPLGVLGPALAAIPRWPSLTRLSVHIYQQSKFEGRRYDYHRKIPPRFQWDLLVLLRNAPALETLDIHVHPSGASPTLEDARALSARLVPLGSSIPREVHVHGFPEDVVR
ncbi:hypothetical protein AURDEDRAFT_116053, partial [Auricularia subglabra TFB-10046 SS5]